MKKKLGFIENVEQFLDVENEICPIDDNIKAFEFFESVGFEDDIVIAPCSIGFINDNSSFKFIYSYSLILILKSMPFLKRRYKLCFF